MANLSSVANPVASVTPSGGYSIKILTTLEQLRRLAKDVDYDHSSTIARVALSILKKNSISKNDLESLFVELEKIKVPPSAFDNLVHFLNWQEQFKRTTFPFLPNSIIPLNTAQKYLTNWFLRLCHPSNVGGAKELRKWLTENGVTLTFIQVHFDYDAKDIMDFSAGFIFGICKSMTYDIVKGIFDLLGLAVTLELLAFNHRRELFENLVKRYQEESQKSVQLAIQSASRLQKAVTEAILDKNFDSDKPATVTAEFVVEINTIVFDFCLNPFQKFVNDEWVNKFDTIYSQIIKLLDETTEEYRKAESSWKYVKGKLDKELEGQVFSLLLEYRYFEAGATAGNLFADIAQILVGIAALLKLSRKLLLRGGKLALVKLLKLSPAQKVKAMAFMMALNTSDARHLRKLPQLTLESPAIALVVESDDLRRVSSAVSEEAVFFETAKVKILDAEVANSLVRDGKAKGQRIPSLFESSTIGGEPGVFVSLLGLYAFLRRRRMFEDAVIEAQKQLFTTAFKVKLIKGYKNFLRVFSDNSFLRKCAEAEDLEIPDEADAEKILDLLLEKWIREFETFIAAEVRKGMKIRKKGIYSRFNSFINRKLRPVAAEFSNQGLIIMVDEPLFKLLEDLSGEALALTKKRKISVKMLLNMTIKDFYETFYPELKMTEGYDSALKKVRSLDEQVNRLYQKRDNLLRTVNEAVTGKTGSNKIHELTEEYDTLNDEIFDRIEYLIEKGKVTSTDRDELLYSAFGKLNPLGKCGSARPDLGIINLVSGNTVYDFIHVSNKGAFNSSHLVGTDFYQDFFRILFGEIPRDRRVTQDIAYSFRKEWLSTLSEP